MSGFSRMRKGSRCGGEEDDGQGDAVFAHRFLSC